MPRRDLSQVRRGTAAQWTAVNPILAAGEAGYETDTNKLKYGNGSTAWNSLDYLLPDATPDPNTTLLGNPITALELSRLSGVTSAVQTQLNSKAATAHTHAIADTTSLQATLDAKLPLAGGTMTGTLTLNGSPSSALHAATKDYVDSFVSVEPTFYNARSNAGGPTTELAGDGVTDDAAKMEALFEYVKTQGGGRIFFPKGIYLCARALQDPGGFNCQVPLPVIDDSAQHVTIELQGETAPPTAFYTETLTKPTGSNFSIIKSTLTGATGTASLMAGKPHASSLIWDNLTFNVRDMVFEMPPNPSLSCLRFSDTIGNRIERVLIHCGAVDFLGVTEPTNSNTYGLICSPWNHSAEMEVNGLLVFGYYNGMRDGELVSCNTATFWGCVRAVVLPYTNFPSRYGTLGVLWCTYGLVSDTESPVPLATRKYLTIEELYIERANSAGALEPPLEWQDSIYDIDDWRNTLYGDIKFQSLNAWDSVNIHSIKVRGGTNLRIAETGKDFAPLKIVTATAPPSFIGAEIGTVADTTVVVTFDQSVKSANFLDGVVINKNGSPATISSATRQSNKAVVHYVLSAAAIAGDDLTFSYTALDGSIGNDKGNQLRDLTGRGVINNVGASTTVLIRDDFIGNDDVTLPAHAISPTNTPANAWVEAVASFVIRDNRARVQGGETIQIATTDAEDADVTIRTVVRRSGAQDYFTADLAIVFRYQDATHHWIADLRASDDTFGIYEIAGGAYIQRASVAKVFEADREYQIEVILSGSSITATVDGGSELTHTSSVLATMTKHGLWAHCLGEATFDRFEVFA